MFGTRLEVALPPAGASGDELRGCVEAHRDASRIYVRSRVLAAAALEVISHLDDALRGRVLVGAAAQERLDSALRRLRAAGGAVSVACAVFESRWARGAVKAPSCWDRVRRWVAGGRFYAREGD
jgi:hypothetical protein